MWAHYANNYKGICLGYSKKVLDEEVSLINKNAPNPTYSIKSAFLVPMEYVDSIPQAFRSIEEPLAIKTKHWMYEDEWRLGMLYSYGNVSIREKGSPHPIKNALKEIIYTDQLKTNELIAIKNIARQANPAIKFFKIELSKGIRKITRIEVK